MTLGSVVVNDFDKYLSINVSASLSSLTEEYFSLAQAV
jgi:hypothetical protein